MRNAECEGESEEKEITFPSPFPIPHSAFLIPHSSLPIPHSPLPIPFMRPYDLAYAALPKTVAFAVTNAC